MIKLSKFITIIILFALGLLLDKATTKIFLPALPEMMHKLHINRSQAQMFLPSVGIGIVFSQLLFGYLANFIHDRILLIILATILSVGALLAVFDVNYYILITAMFIQGFGVGVLFSLSQSLLPKHYPDQAIKVFSFASMSLSYATPLLILFGALLFESFGWSSLYLLILCTSLIAMIFASLLPDETSQVDLSEISIGHLCRMYKAFFQNRLFIKYALSIALFNSSLAIFYTISPFLIIHDLGYSKITYSYMLFIPLTGLFIGRLINGWICQFFQCHQLVFFSLLWSLAISLLMFFVAFIWTNAFITLFLFMLYLIGLGICSPNARVTAMTAVNKHIGFAASILTLLTMFFCTCASTIAAQFSDDLMTGLMVSFSAMNLFIFILIKDQEA